MNDVILKEILIVLWIIGYVNYIIFKNLTYVEAVLVLFVIIGDGSCNLVWSISLSWTSNDIFKTFCY